MRIINFLILIKIDFFIGCLHHQSVPMYMSVFASSSSNFLVVIFRNFSHCCSLNLTGWCHRKIIHEVNAATQFLGINDFAVDMSHDNFFRERNAFLTLDDESENQIISLVFLEDSNYTGTEDAIDAVDDVFELRWKYLRTKPY